MLRSLAGALLILHGLVHTWYVLLAQGIVEFHPKMGWDGKSWALSGILTKSRVRLLASISYSLAATVFVVGAGGLIAAADWSRWTLLASAIFSTIVILTFWDGRAGMLVQKGLVATLINIAVIVLALVL